MTGGLGDSGALPRPGRRARPPGPALTPRAGFYSLTGWIAARSELVRLGYRQAAAGQAMGRRVTVLQGSGGFSDILAIPVALSRQACRVLATVAVLAIAGCAAAPPASPEARQNVVEARAQARWEAVIKGNMEAAYAYISPASRQVYSLDRFKAQVRRGSIRTVKIDSVSCPAETCEVRLTLTYDHRLMKGIPAAVTETWVWSDGQAWYVVRE